MMAIWHKAGLHCSTFQTGFQGNLAVTQEMDAMKIATSRSTVNRRRISCRIGRIARQDGFAATPRLALQAM